MLRQPGQQPSHLKHTFFAVDKIGGNHSPLILQHPGFSGDAFL
jgi:hypothetical protein